MILSLQYIFLQPELRYLLSLIMPHLLCRLNIYPTLHTVDNLWKVFSLFHPVHHRVMSEKLQHISLYQPTGHDNGATAQQNQVIIPNLLRISKCIVHEHVTDD